MPFYIHDGGVQIGSVFTKWSHDMHCVALRVLGISSLLTCSGIASGGMNGLTYDVIGTDLVADTYTVRVYAELDAGSRLDACFGGSVYSGALMYRDGAAPYQNDLGGPTSQSINSAFFQLAPSLEWDSYVTIGSLYSDGTPFAENALQDIGIDWSPWESGHSIFADNGTWFVTPVDPQGEEIGGRVLIAQLTTFAGSGPSDIFMSFGFQGKDSDGQPWQSGHSLEIWIPAPAVLPVLCLAGLTCGRGRPRQ